MAAKDYIVAIELGSSKVTGIAGTKNVDGSINVAAVVKEDSSSFIRRGVVYNIDKTAQCIQRIIQQLQTQIKLEITKVYVGVGGQSLRSIKNVVHKDLMPNTKVTDIIVDDMMDTNRGKVYAEKQILETVQQEYKVDNQYIVDPVGIQCSRLDGNFLNILQRESFYNSLYKCFEIVGVEIADTIIAPLALADSVLTEPEKRSGCALVDIGASTTTVSVYTKNYLRHLIVIPLGSNNITKDIASLQIEESEAETLKLKHASAFTEPNDIDDTLEMPLNAERNVAVSKFINIVEARLEEIIKNVYYQISEFEDKLLGGVILTGGGSNMQNIAKAFTYHTNIEKVRIASFVTQTINTPIAKDGTMNTILSLLIKGDQNCVGGPFDPSDMFSATERDRRTKAMQKRREEEARKKAEEEERLKKAKEEEEEAERQKEEERKNKPSVGKKISQWFTNIFMEED